jgi:dolichyl-phosphate beta-glucosyltransferase
MLANRMKQNASCGVGYLWTKLMTIGNIAREEHRVSLVIPCFNEALRLDVPRFQQYLARNSRTRILFVDDGSTDDTVYVLEKLRAGYENCTEVLLSTSNKGKAEAVRRGINNALENLEQEIVGYWDADLATPLDAVEPFSSILDSRPEIEMVFGSRVKLLGRYVQRRPARHYLGRVFATVVSQMLRLPIYDTQCGAKLFRVTPETRKIFAEPFLSKWVFDVEIIARYLKLKGGDPAHLEQIIYEYPLETWVDIPGSKVRAKDFLKALQDLFRIKRKYL